MKPLTWINTALLALVVAGVAVLLYRQHAELSVQCLDDGHPAVQLFVIDEPGYCLAVAPSRLDRDSRRPSQ